MQNIISEKLTSMSLYLNRRVVAQKHKFKFRKLKIKFYKIYFYTVYIYSIL